MGKVCILQNMAHGTPGYLAELMQRHHIDHTVIAVNKNEAVPSTAKGLRALVVLGGIGSVRNHRSWLDQERKLIQHAMDAGIPILGHSLGAELIAEVLGGSIVRNAVDRIGWFPVNRCENSLAAEWLAGLPHEFTLFCWHNQTFSIPHGATPILTSEWCLNEAFVYGNVLAMQGHLEMTAPMIDALITEFADKLFSPSNEVHTEDNLVLNWDSVIQGPDMITLNLPRRIAELHRTAEAIYGHWLQRIEEVSMTA